MGFCSYGNWLAACKEQHWIPFEYSTSNRTWLPKHHPLHQGWSLPAPGIRKRCIRSNTLCNSLVTS